MTAQRPAAAARSAGFDIRQVLGPWQDPAITGIFGDMSTGKDFDAWTAFAGRCFGVGPRGGITKPAVTSGYPMDPSLYGEANTLEQAHSIIASTLAAFPGRFLAVIVTDISVLSKGTHDAMRPSYPESHNFTFWRDFGMKHDALVGTLRQGFIFGALTGHVKEGGINKQDGKFYKGGIKTPGKETTKALSHSLDLALRCGTDPSRYGFWKGIYHCTNHNPDWEEKDRHGVLHGEAPQNLGEILRLAGYNLPRPPGLEWQEEWVQGIAKAILVDGKKPEDVAPKVFDHLLGQAPEPLVYWTVRDGIDRALLRLRQRNLRRGF